MIHYNYTQCKTCSTRTHCDNHKQNMSQQWLEPWILSKRRTHPLKKQSLNRKLISRDSYKHNLSKKILFENKPFVSGNLYNKKLLKRKPLKQPGLNKPRPKEIPNQEETPIFKKLDQRLSQELLFNEELHNMFNIGPFEPCGSSVIAPPIFALQN